MKLPELLLPAGSFESAIAAIEGGADALYFGFSDFSARKQARNLDRLEYRRLLGFARERGVRLYAALNTVVLERELEPLIGLLVFLARFPPDALIIQDWGLASLVQEEFPGLTLHASTQMAIQTPEAARLACRLGVKRIVLPRESSLVDLRRFVAEVPDMEFEVFVHGALCYSFSGLCLASGTLLGRSGNRGECAQVCRSYYSLETGGGRGGAAYWFSCRDLCLADRVADLTAAGAVSLKVEGRMKAPEYGFAVARLYRGLLDRVAGKHIDDEELAARSEAAKVAFSRAPTEAWFASRGGEALIDPQFPGHRGAIAGTIVSVGGGKIVVDLHTSLGLRDGALIFEEGDGTRPLPFSVSGLRDARSGREIGIARAGLRVELDCPGATRPGDELRRISARELDRRTPSPEEYPPLRQDLDATLILEQGGMGLQIDTPLYPGDQSPPLVTEPGDTLIFQRARRQGSFVGALSIFGESGQADFHLCPRFPAGVEVMVESERGTIPVPDLFLPPSLLKREKNRLYDEARRRIDERLAIRTRYLAERPVSLPRPAALGGSIPPRSSLVFPNPELKTGFPFATARRLREGSPLPSHEGRSFLPLAPLVADWPAYADLVTRRAKSALEAGEPIVLGLDALHHLAFAQSLVEELGPQESRGGLLSFFLDIHLYVANRFALSALASLPWLRDRLDFAYFYLEAGNQEFAELRSALGTDHALLAEVDEGFEPPLFLSAGCLRKHHEEGGLCSASCDRSWIRRLRDRERSYLVLVEDCVSLLFRERHKF